MWLIWIVLVHLAVAEMGQLLSPLFLPLIKSSILRLFSVKSEDEVLKNKLSYVSMKQHI